MTALDTQQILEPEAKEFYCHTLSVFEQNGIDMLVGGAYAFARYTGIERHTKDLDVFVKQDDFDRTLRALERAGYGTEVPFPHWLGKAHHGDYFVDIIYSSGNGIAHVDNEWFACATADHVFDVPVRLCPAEEMIWSKALIQERERFDGADVAHIILAYGDRLDWRRLLDRFGPHWRVLLSHLVLYGFIYPSARSRIPAWVMRELLERLAPELDGPDADDPVCYGTLLSWSQYLGDVFGGSFRDARIRPYGSLSAEEVARWTAADKR
jgi:hypothetical protein